MKNKIIAIALALTTVMSVAPFAGAATTDDLQAQINQLSEQLKQISQILTALTAQGTITATPAVSASNCFTKTLQKGVTNDEVKALQTALKSDSSIYPEGLVTGYFGPLTEAAVKKFQAKYGIDQTGIVGPNTRAKLNSLYCATTTTPTTTTTATATVTPTATVAPSYGTLSVNEVPVANPFSELYAGNTYEVFAAEFKATGSDITIRKIAINMTSDNMFPWQKFASVSLWDGSTKLAELAVNQSNLIENSFATDYTANISGLNIVVPNGQKKTITTKVTLLPALTTTAQTASFTVSMTPDIVYVDTAGVVYTNLQNLAKTTITKKVESVKESNKANFVVSTATDNPVAANVVASKSNTTPVTLLSLSVKNDSDVSATINKASTTVTVASTTTGQYITSVELWDGSTRIQTASANLSATTSANVTWENFTLPIAANTTKNLVVKAVVASLNNATLKGDGTETVKADNFWMQGIDANSNVIGGRTAITGNAQYVFLKAPVFALSSAVLTASAGDNENPQSVGNAKIVMNITAQGGSDIYIKSASTSLKVASKPNDGVATVTSAFTCTSGAFSEDYDYRIPAGNTAVCELNGVIQLTASTQNGFYQVQVATTTWSIDKSFSATTTVAQDWGWDNFKTGLTNLIHK